MSERVERRTRGYDEVARTEDASLQGRNPFWDADFFGRRNDSRGRCVSLDGTEDRPAAVSPPAQYLPREENGWMATLRSGAF